MKKVINAHRYMSQPSYASLYSIFFCFATVGMASVYIGEATTLWGVRKQINDRYNAVTGAEEASYNELEEEWNANPIGFLPKKTKAVTPTRTAVRTPRVQTRAERANPCGPGSHPTGVIFRYGKNRITCSVRTRG